MGCLPGRGWLVKLDWSFALVRHRQHRPTPGQLGVERSKVLLCLRHGSLFVNGIHRTRHNTHCAVDANVRIDNDEIVAFMKTVNRAHNDAVGVLALVAAFGDDMGHRKSSWPAGCGTLLIGYLHDGERPMQEMKL